MKQFFTRTWVCHGLIGLLTLLAWGESTQFGFVWDDHFFVLENKSVQSLNHLPEMFYSLKAQSCEPESFVLFRPLRTVLYAFFYAAGQKDLPNPWIFHAANIVWHAAAAMLLFSVATLLFKRIEGVEPAFARVAGFLVGAAFAVHPVTSEVVCWVKSLDDIMATVFVLAATRALLRQPAEKTWNAAALIFFALAVYSKESAVPFALMVVFLFYVIHNLSWRQSARRALPFLGIALVYVVHRHLVIGRTSQIAPISGSYGQTLLDTLPAAGIYFRLLWGIPPFCIDYTYMPKHLGLSNPAVLTGGLLVAAGISLTFWTWQTKKWRLVALGLLWFGLFLLPVSNIVPMMQFAAERFLYLPLVGWLLAVGAALLYSGRRGLLVGLLAALVVVWIPISQNRAQIWRDEITLFIQTMLDNKNCKRIRENAIISFFFLNHIAPYYRLTGPDHLLCILRSVPADKASLILPSMEQAHDLFPEDERCTRALGLTYAFAGQFTNAIPALELATQQKTNDADCWGDLGTAYMAVKDWANAHRAFETALRISPTNQFALRQSEQLRKTGSLRER